jgi:putative transposase
VRSIVNGLDPGMVTLALEGPASYRDKHELLLRRRADHPNAIWQADHTMLDLLIVGPDGKPARPWLAVILDDYSRAVCGYMVFLGAPSAANTALALRQAIWHKPEPDWPVCGIPDVLYTDHGSDFTSHRIGDTAAVLHLRIIHSQVARPQGRGKIERFFGTINTELLPTLPGHLARATEVAERARTARTTTAMTFQSRVVHSRRRPRRSRRSAEPAGRLLMEQSFPARPPRTAGKPV